MSNIDAIFTGMTRHPTNAASSFSFHIVHLGPDASNWWTTFLCSTHGLVGNHLQSFIIRPKYVWWWTTSKWMLYTAYTHSFVNLLSTRERTLGQPRTLYFTSHAAKITHPNSCIYWVVDNHMQPTSKDFNWHKTIRFRSRRRRRAGAGTWTSNSPQPNTNSWWFLESRHIFSYTRSSISTTYNTKHSWFCNVWLSRHPPTKYHPTTTVYLPEKYIWAPLSVNLPTKFNVKLWLQWPKPSYHIQQQLLLL